MKNKFLIGEFAKLMNVSKQTLRYYDNIDLFKPNFIDTENNYRYYTINQAEILDIILMLKEIGVSLNEIKDYINNRDLEKCIKTLYEQKININNKIKKLSKIETKLDSTIKKMLQYQNLDNNNAIQIKDLKEQYLIVNKVKYPHNDEKIAWAISEIINNTRHLDIDVFDGDGAIVLKDDVLKGNYKVSFVFSKVNKYLEIENIHIKPKGKYATIYHRGRYEDSYKSYIKLLDFIEKNNLEIISDAYEISLIDSFSNSVEDEFLTEIQICVKERK